MSFRIFSRQIRSSSANRPTGRRVLRLERLENRQLLSIGLGPTASMPNVSPSSTPPAVQAAPYAVPAAMVPADPGPTIGMVVVSASANVITWNAVDSIGVGTTRLAIDGLPAADVYGPYAAASGADYAGVYGSLSAGSHTYVITATDNAGNSSQYTGALNVGALNAAGPTISMVTLSAPDNLITWNAAGSDGVAMSSLAIDGSPIGQLYGPYTASTGVNYAGVYGTLLSGTHTYAITATDDHGNSSLSTGTFDVAGPTISMVVADTAQSTITWNIADSAAVASSTLTVDGTDVTTIYGPYAASTGLDYAGAYPSLASGSHSYVIQVADSAGGIAQYAGTFVQGPTISGVIASESTGLITWNAVALSGVASSSLTIDGVSVTKLYGPYAATSGVNYAGAFDPLSSGTHTYVITATDNNGVVSQYTGTFAPGPTISGVAVSYADKVMTWNAASTIGVAASGLTVDGTVIRIVQGPYLAPSGYNFLWGYGVLAPGTHSYVITATDILGNSSQYAGTLTIPS